MSIETNLQDIIDEINHLTGKNKNDIKETIEDLMASDNDFTGHWAETYDILVRSQEPDKYHYDIYIKVGCVWANNWLSHKKILSDYMPLVDRVKKEVE